MPNSFSISDSHIGSREHALTTTTLTTTMQQGNARNAARAGPDPSSAISQRVLVNDQEYVTNQQKIEALQGVLDDWKSQNEQGHNDYRTMEAEMTRLIQLGEQARWV
jgi:hypothetical protein